MVALHGSQACQGRALRSFRARAPHLLAQQAIAGLLLLLALRPMVHEAHGSCMAGRYLRPLVDLGTDLMELGLRGWGLQTRRVSMLGLQVKKGWSQVLMLA